MSPATLERQIDPTVIRARRGAPKHNDADVYAEIARAWYRMRPSSDHTEYPMRKHVVTPNFARQVWGRAGIDPQAVIDVCARVVSEDDWRLNRQARQTAKCGRLEHTLDPVTGWWYPLNNTETVGLHFWRLVIGTIELRSVGPVDESPPLQSGRFGMRER